ncbi:hypothetical protein MFIFM68171_02069 [Madurella fahalii]|uniref:Nephrocystin 3-like N-terminal domain-containing protein n=1 Tax=Madurella fahalii TaxID=1157608 RepID=A0ABQ0G2B1_9PEZI
MDPVTAFQVGASVIAFVDFAYTLVSTGYEVYKSPDGRTGRIVQLSKVAEDLNSVRARIEKGIARFPSSESDHELLILCQECRRIGAALESTVQSLTARGTSKLNYAKSSFVVATKGLWKDGEIQALNESLEQVRSRVMMALMISVWQDVKLVERSNETIQRKLDDIASQLGEVEKPIIQEVANIRASNPTGIENQNEPRERQVQTLAEDLWLFNWQPDLDGQGVPSSQWINRAILKSLSFTDMDNRDTMVTQAYKNTFQWVFSRGAGACGFSQWLETDSSDVFWITGKPGSGKSTLMKYITSCRQQLEKHLGEWANGLPLIWATYYFWDAGSNQLQKSREGMMRTLLYRCLEQRPDLLPLVTPRRYAMYSVLNHAHFRAPAWEWEELHKALSRLAAESSKSFRLVLFIDGLDEFSGDRAQMISFIKLLNTEYDIKICVSSRPWTEFADALGQNPRLTMQSLTRNDILFFIKHQLEGHQAFMERQKASSTTQSLIDDIAQGAEGVFLWVAVVVRSVIQLLTAGKTIREIRSFVRSIPPDMSELFTKIWDAIEPKWKEASSRLFQVKVAALNIMRLDVKLLWRIEEGPLPDGKDDEVIRVIWPILRRKLDMHTRGILEIAASGSVEFLHRSAKDWILGHEIWNTIKSKTPPEYDPSLALLKAATTQLLPNTDLYSAWSEIASLLTAARNVANRPEVVPRLVVALDELNSILSHLAGADECKNPTMFSTMHWVSRFDKDRYKFSDHDAETCFVELAARFAILPYVKAKVSLHPELLRQPRRRKRMSLLEGAIYGPDEELVSRWAHTDEWSGSRQLPIPQRWELINCLLDAGDSPGRKAYRRKCQRASWKLPSGWSILEQVSGEWEWREREWEREWERELKREREQGREWERAQVRERKRERRRERAQMRVRLREREREREREWELMRSQQNMVNPSGIYFDEVLRLLQEAQTTRQKPGSTTATWGGLTERFLQLLH